MVDVVRAQRKLGVITYELRAQTFCATSGENICVHIAETFCKTLSSIQFIVLLKEIKQGISYFKF